VVLLNSVFATGVRLAVPRQRHCRLLGQRRASRSKACRRHKAAEGLWHRDARHLHLLLSSVEFASVLLREKMIPGPKEMSRK